MAFIPIPIEAESGSFAFTGIPADIMFTASARSGAQITTAGQYEVTFNFTVTGITTGIKIRLNASGADGAGTAVTFTDSGSASFKRFANVTDVDLSAGDVFLLIESSSVSGTESITWEHSELAIRRIGGVM